MTQKTHTTPREHFQRAFKFCRFEENKSFEDAQQEAIWATCANHIGSIHDHGDDINVALRDVCLNHRELWGDDVRPDDNRWFQHFKKVV